MREVRFEVEGESIAGELHEPEGECRGQLVMVHGLLSQRAEFADAPAMLARRGWRALAIDQRGFGASGGPRGLIHADRSVADTLAAVEWLRKDLPGAPVGVVGHSMGAVFALGALARDPSIPAGVVASPMRRIRDEIGEAEFLAYRAGDALSRLMARAGLGPLVIPYKNRYRDLFLDADAARRAQERRFLSATVSLANYEALMAMDAAEVARRVRQPVLTLVARHDRVVKAASSRAVHDALAGPKEMVTLECGHSMFGDCEAGRAVDAVDRWMGLHLRAAPRAA